MRKNGPRAPHRGACVCRMMDFDVSLLVRRLVFSWTVLLSVPLRLPVFCLLRCILFQCPYPPSPVRSEHTPPTAVPPLSSAVRSLSSLLPMRIVYTIPYTSAAPPSATGGPPTASFCSPISVPSPHYCLLHFPLCIPSASPPSSRPCACASVRAVPRSRATPRTLGIWSGSVRVTSWRSFRSRSSPCSVRLARDSRSIYRRVSPSVTKSPLIYNSFCVLSLLYDVCEGVLNDLGRACYAPSGPVHQY